MIIDATEAGQAPAGRYMARVEEQRAFDRAFPAAVQSNLADRDSVTPVVAARCDRRHPAARPRAGAAHVR